MTAVLSHNICLSQHDSSNNQQCMLSMTSSTLLGCIGTAPWLYLAGSLRGVVLGGLQRGLRLRRGLLRRFSRGATCAVHLRD